MESFKLSKEGYDPTSKGEIFAVLILVLLGAWWVLGPEKKEPAPPPAPVATPKHYRVEYRVTGEANRLDATYENGTGGANQETLILPWSKSFQGEPGQNVYLSVQTDKYGQSVKAEILLDGKVIKSATANSKHGIATVSGRL